MVRATDSARPTSALTPATNQPPESCAWDACQSRRDPGRLGQPPGRAHPVLARLRHPGDRDPRPPVCAAGGSGRSPPLAVNCAGSSLGRVLSDIHPAPHGVQLGDTRCTRARDHDAGRGHRLAPGGHPGPGRRTRRSPPPRSGPGSARRAPGRCRRSGPSAAAAARCRCRRRRTAPGCARSRTPGTPCHSGVARRSVEIDPEALAGPPAAGRPGRGRGPRPRRAGSWSAGRPVRASGPAPSPSGWSARSTGSIISPITAAEPSM